MNETAHPHRLEHFPITLLPTVMGLAGLAIVLLKFGHVVHLEAPVGRMLLYVVSGWFAFVLFMHGAKLVRYPAEVRKEFRHPVRVNFFPAISISLLLLAIGYLEADHAPVARVLWWIGAPLHLLFLLVVMRRWFLALHHVNTFNPAWFIPVVGPIIVPVAGVAFAPVEVSWFFFATGLVFWIALLAVLLNRIFFHDPLPGKLVPTLFILIAPPAVGCIAYVKLTGALDPFVHVLFNFGLFVALLLTTMADVFRRTPFFVSWWAYTFPLDAFTLSLYLMAGQTGAPAYRWAALVMTGVTTLVIAVVLGRTVQAAFRGEICVPEE
jgi:tellurite resistance protein